MTRANKSRKGCLVASVLCLGLLVCCTRNYNEEDLTVSVQTREEKAREEQEQKEERLVKTNRVLLQKEKERIVSYFSRRGWKMQEVKGVWVEIIRQGEGGRLAEGERIAVDYTCSLLNGEMVYGSEKDGKLLMQIGKAAECPLGLQLVLETLSIGTKARVIVPYNLAYGLSGDGKRVPKSASLVYELSIEKLK